MDEEYYVAKKKANGRQKKCGEICLYNAYTAGNPCHFGYREKGCYLETSYYNDIDTPTVVRIGRLLETKDDRHKKEWLMPTPKRKAPKKATEHLGLCGEECKYRFSDGRCAFGMRDTWGCWLETEGIENKLRETMMLQEFKYTTGIGLLSKDSEKAKIIDDMTVGKTFNFMYEGHEYVLSDSARTQYECPHCGEKSPDEGEMWKPKHKGYIGYKKLAEKKYVYCFQCPNCHEHFFYHNIIPPREKP